MIDAGACRPAVLTSEPNEFSVVPAPAVMVTCPAPAWMTMQENPAARVDGTVSVTAVAAVQRTTVLLSASASEIEVAALSAIVSDGSGPVRPVLPVGPAGPVAPVTFPRLSVGMFVSD